MWAGHEKRSQIFNWQLNDVTRESRWTLERSGQSVFRQSFLALCLCWVLRWAVSLNSFRGRRNGVDSFVNPAENFLSKVILGATIAVGTAAGLAYWYKRRLNESPPKRSVDASNQLTKSFLIWFRCFHQMETRWWDYRAELLSSEIVRSNSTWSRWLSHFGTAIGASAGSVSTINKTILEIGLTFHIRFTECSWWRHRKVNSRPLGLIRNWCWSNRKSLKTSWLYQPQTTMKSKWILMSWMESARERYRFGNKRLEPSTAGMKWLNGFRDLWPMLRRTSAWFSIPSRFPRVRFEPKIENTK